MIKSKPCTVENCVQPRWAKGLCKRHQSLRTDGKAPKGIKKISEKGVKKKKLKKELFENDAAFYFRIWSSRPHICFETGKQLGKMNLCMFHHILPKQSYPEFRHCDWNIVLLDPDIHNQVETRLDMCPAVERLTNELKEKYGNPSNGRLLNDRKQKGPVSGKDTRITEELSEL